MKTLKKVFGKVYSAIFSHFEIRLSDITRNLCENVQNITMPLFFSSSQKLFLGGISKWETKKRTDVSKFYETKKNERKKSIFMSFFFFLFKFSRLSKGVCVYVFAKTRVTLLIGHASKHFFSYSDNFWLYISLLHPFSAHNFVVFFAHPLKKLIYSFHCTPHMHTSLYWFLYVCLCVCSA